MWRGRRACCMSWARRCTCGRSRITDGCSGRCSAPAAGSRWRCRATRFTSPSPTPVRRWRRARRRGLRADGVPLRDLGEHRLKDLLAPVRLYQLGEGEFPPLTSLYRTNLPVPGTPFLGRARELGEVGALLARADVRLLTLTGPG